MHLGVQHLAEGFADPVDTSKNPCLTRALMIYCVRFGGVVDYGESARAVRRRSAAAGAVGGGRRSVAGERACALRGGLFRARARRAARPPFEGRPTALRPRGDVRDPAPSGLPLAVGRADPVPYYGPSLVHAVPRAVAGKPSAMREFDLKLPRGADAGVVRRRPGDRGVIPALRGAALDGGRHRHGGADRRGDRGGGAEAGQHRGREARAEGSISEAWASMPAELARKDRDARWSVKLFKARPAADGAARGHRHPDLRLQGRCRHRPPPRTDPHLDRHRRRPPRRRAVARAARQGQPRERGLGGHRLPLGEERGASGSGRLHQAHPPQETAVQADADACLPRQTPRSPLCGRRSSTSSPARKADGARHPHHRPRASDLEDRAATSSATCAARSGSMVQRTPEVRSEAASTFDRNQQRRKAPEHVANDRAPSFAGCACGACPLSGVKPPLLVCLRLGFGAPAVDDRTSTPWTYTCICAALNARRQP